MRLVIFGVTGSIGTQAIDIIKNNKNIQLVGYSFFHNYEKAKEIKRDFPKAKQFITNKNTTQKEIGNFLKLTKPDYVLNSVCGSSGLKYTIATLKSKINLLLANKESLVISGKKVINLAAKNKLKIYPVDSEHTALYCLLKYKDQTKTIKRYYITVSGGRYFDYSITDLKKIKYLDAINHPNWKMGEKISIDSATLLNKSFEIIEAYWLFNKIKVNAIVEPTSNVHAMIEYNDGSVDAFIDKPNMIHPIKWALEQFEGNYQRYIKKYKSFKDIPFVFKDINKTNLLGMKYAKLMLQNIDTNISRFICLADDKAINLFKQGKIDFLGIYHYIDQVIKLKM